MTAYAQQAYNVPNDLNLIGVWAMEPWHYALTTALATIRWMEMNRGPIKLHFALQVLSKSKLIYFLRSGTGPTGHCEWDGTKRNPRKIHSFSMP
jgi:hypothetical protein